MTLLEIMIVIFIIGIIGSVIGYKMKGSLDKGKAFKTKEGIAKIYEIVELERGYQNVNLKEGKIEDTVLALLENSGLVRNPNALLKDGWGSDYALTYDDKEDEFRVHSQKYVDYCQKNGLTAEYPW